MVAIKNSSGDITGYTLKPRSLFGKLPDGLSSNEIFSKKLAGTYGLYSDNVFLKGSLITEGGDYSAGISTDGLFTLSVNEEIEDIIFWAGSP
jgi:hypothetical protein